MENKCKRFLSLLLAFVMVLGLFPMGHAHAEAAIVGEAKVLNDDRVVSLADCEYTFTLAGEYWQITGTTADGETVYVNPCATKNAVIPQSTAEANLKLYDGSVSGSMHISGSKGSLHFHNTQASPWWNKCGSDYTNKTDADHDVYFFKASAAAADSVIPGYEQVTALSDVVEGKYLIAAKNTAGNWFVMHPSKIDGTADAEKQDHIALVGTKIQMNIGDTYSVELDGTGAEGTYGDEIVSAKVVFKPTLTKVAGVTPVTEIESGATYAIVSARSGSDAYGGTYGNYYMTNNHITKGNGENGLELVAAFDDCACWTITAVDGGYTISDGSKNLNIVKNGSVNLADEAMVQIVASPITEGAWEIRNADGIQLNYYNSFGAASSTGGAASAWKGDNDPGSQWYLYEVTEAPVYTYVKGDQLGQDDAIVGGGKYIFYNLRQGKTLLNTTHPSQKAFLHLNGDLNNPSASSIWTINEAEDGKFYLQDANGRYVTFPRDGASMTDTQTALEIYWQNTHKYGDEDGNWLIKLGGEYLGNHGGPSAYKAGGWHEMPDGGAYWFLYKAIETPVGTNVLTFTALSAGDTTITIGGESYRFHVHGWADATCTTPKTCSGCGATEGEALGHSYEPAVTTEPTCTEDGVKTFTCACGDSYTEAIPATGHTDGNGDYKCDVCGEALCTEHDWIDATCTTPKTCSKCGATEGEALGHSYEPAVTTEPTCTTDGVKTFTCACGDSYTEVIPAKGDTPGAEATCTTAQTCTVCGAELVAALGHDWVDATCTTPKTCSKCGATEGEALGHSYSNDYDPDCNVCGADRQVKTFNSEKLTGLTGEGSSVDESEAGFDKSVGKAFDGDNGTFWATVPNGSLSDAYLIADLNGTYLINKVAYTKRFDSGAKYNCTGNLLNYIIEVSNDNGATWTKVAEGDTVDGTTEITFAPVLASKVRLTSTSSYHWQEANRNTVMTAAEFAVFKAVCLENEHTPGAEATCTEDQICTVCGTVLVAAHHTPAEPVVENEKAATCTEDGSYDNVVYCTVCEAELSRETNTVDALGHTAGDPVIENEKAASCTEDGSYDSVVYCSVCKAELSRETFTVDALGHTAGDPVVENEKAATCTEDGSYDTVVYCSVCDAELSRETNTVDALGHTAGKAVIENEVGATCAADGSYDSVVYCSVCGEELSRETNTIPALEHTPAEAVKENEKAATCTEDGSYDLVVYCSVCDAEISRETNTVDALGHEEIPHEAKDPTCTESGWDAYVTCSRCDYTTYEEIPAVGHTDKNGDYICDVCGEALCTDHDWIDATCTAPKTCSKCGVTEGKALGHTEQTVKGHTGTCFEPGLSDGVICSVCGTVLVAQEETAPVHTLIVHVDASAPTCTKNGNIEYWYCVECGSAWLDEECRFNTNLRAIILPATGHNYEAVFTQDPTCTEHGYTSYACTVCGHTIVGDYVTALGHNPGEPVIENEKAASCTEDGSYDTVVYCTVCDAEISRETNTVDALGHTAGEPVVENEKAATCTEDGSYDTVVYCTVCEAEISRETNTVDALGHTAGEPVIENEKAATCTEDGSYDTVVYCTVCEAEISRETNTVDALGHTAGEPVVENEKAATCTEDGSYDSVVYCTVCEAEISRETNTVDALGHTAGEPVIENEKAATCTEDGSYDNVVYCSVCEAEISRETVPVPAKGHRFSKVEVTPATCTEDGYVTITCGNCNKTFVSGKDAEADQYLVDHPYFDLKAKGHTAGEPVIENEKDATCTEDGSYDLVVYCTVCDAEISRETNTVDALGHTAGEPVVENEKAATCTEDGSYDSVVYCSVCEAEISRETNTVDALGHTAGEPVVENEKAATCTEDGSYDNVVYCSVCDAEISRETIPVPAKGHRFSKVEVTPATCTEDGYVTITCGNCNKTFVSGKDAEADQYLVDHPYFDLKAKGHTAGEPVVENEKAATCTEDGSYDLVVYCTVCEAEISRETTAIPAAHSYVNGGYLTQRCCTVCNAICEGFDNDSLYINGWLQQAYQLVEYQGAIYFVGDAHKIVKDTTYYLTEEFTNGEFFPDGRAIQPGYYEFDADGKMVIPEAPAVKNGVIDGYLYINDQMQKAYKLVEFEGSLYFISDAHKVAVSTSLYLNENFVAGVMVPGTDRELVPGYYEFDAEGKMLIPEAPAVKNGVIDGYLYINDQMQKAYKLVEFEGSLYFISDAHKVAVSTSLYLNEDFVANVKVPGTDKALKPGYYEFDAEGKMVITEVKEGVIDGYLYIDGEMQKAYQLVEFENHIYFVYDAHKIAVSTRLYLSEQFVEGKTFNGEPIAVGYYEFDENGWMIIE